MGDRVRSDTLREVFRGESYAACSSSQLCGQVLPGDYRVIELLREDDKCSVYRALQLALEREVTIELLRRELCGDRAALARFAIEARVASRLTHPNTVDLIDFRHTAAGEPYVVKELVRGIALGRLRREHGPLSLARVLDLIEQVLSALTEAHGLGLVHGDLRPENVIVRALANGQELVKVIEFGLAPVAGPADVARDLDAVGAMLLELTKGTIPPEPLRGVLDRTRADAACRPYRGALELHEDLLQARAACDDLGWQDDASELMGCPSCASCVPIARHCCDCGRPLVLSSITVPAQICA
jgi:serine/threonine protein kinase